MDRPNLTGKTCSIDGCNRPHYARGWCNGHYQRWFKRGAVGSSPLQGRESRGAWHRKSDGYMRLSVGGREVMEHRHIMETLLGRPLLPIENVHHRNGIRHDNRPENLELWSRSQPHGQRVADKVEWAKALLALYEPEALARHTADLQRGQVV